MTNSFRQVTERLNTAFDPPQIQEKIVNLQISLKTIYPIDKSHFNMESNRFSNNVTSANNIATSKWEDSLTVNDTFMKEVESLLTFKIAMIVNRYWFSALVPIGLVGNRLLYLFL